jgi:hypothetical protein
MPGLERSRASRRAGWCGFLPGCRTFVRHQARVSGWPQPPIRSAQSKSGKAENAEKFGASRRRESLQALAEDLLHLLERHE